MKDGLAMIFFWSVSIGHVSYRFTEHYQLTTNKYLETITEIEIESESY